MTRAVRHLPRRLSFNSWWSAMNQPAPLPTRWRSWQIAAAWLLVAIGALLTGYLVVALLPQVTNTDFIAYRGGIGLMLSGGSLYDLAADQVLYFVYPPFAGLLLAPIGLMPPTSGFLVWIILQIACCVWLAIAVCRPAVRTATAPESWLVPALASVGLLFSEPVNHSIAIGQMGVVLALLVVVDHQLPLRWRGLLTGVAGAVKLIPLVFLPYYVVTRQWRAARNLGLAFGTATMVAFAVLPQDSLRYWGHLLFGMERIGEPSVRRNKSLLGLLEHAGLDGWVLQSVWLVLVGVVTVLALRKAAEYHRAGDEMGAVIVVGLLSTMILPISWPHYLIWALLAAIRLLLSAYRWSRLAGGALWLALIVNTPLMGFDDTAPAWLLVPESLLTLALAAVAILGVGTLATLAPATAPRTPTRAT